MEQQPNKDKMSTIGNESSSSTKVKELFFVWLSAGNAKKYIPSVYISCIDKASDYLIQRKIISVDLWQHTNFEFFKSVYNKALNDNLFKVTEKKTYNAFIQSGQAFLKFLKSKPILHKNPVTTQESLNQPSNLLTIREAIIRVLENEHTGLTAEQIYNQIIAEGLYSFGAQNPQGVVRVEIDRACINSNYSIRASKDYFRFERNQIGEKVYFLLPSKLTDEQPITKSNTIEIWNDTTKQKFQSWMESMNYSTATVRHYCGAVGRTIQNFKSIADIAIRDSQTEKEATLRFIELLYQDNEFIVTNKTGHNMYSAALTAFVRFFESDASIIIGNSPVVETVVDSGLDNIIDLEEGKKSLREILDNHFLTLYGYSNIGILWSAAQNSLPMFLNDNAINSSDDLWNFVTRAFKNEFVFNSPHIWGKPPDYPQSSKGLIINLARQHGGVVTREQIDNFFSQIKLTSLFNSFVLEKEQFIFYDKAKFILTETVNLDDNRCSLITNALNTLFSSENTTYIVLRDIKSSWFSSLPGLSNGFQWTPLLLQELLRICPSIGYKAILPNLKQALDTIGAAIVPRQSEIETFADVVHRFCFEEYELPYKLPSEELRLNLREVGMIEGNELIYNMHKALKDYRFAFSDENRTVMILER